MAELITIERDEYDRLKLKEKVADDIVLQLESSLHDMEAGRVRRVR